MLEQTVKETRTLNRKSKEQVNVFSRIKKYGNKVGTPFYPLLNLVIGKVSIVSQLIHQFFDSLRVNNSESDVSELKDFITGFLVSILLTPIFHIIGTLIALGYLYAAVIRYIRMKNK